MNLSTVVKAGENLCRHRERNSVKLHTVKNSWPVIEKEYKDFSSSRVTALREFCFKQCDKCLRSVQRLHHLFSGYLCVYIYIIFLHKTESSPQDVQAVNLAVLNQGSLITIRPKIQNTLLEQLLMYKVF